MFILWEIALGGEVVDFLMAFFAGCIASVVNLLINPLMWLVIIGIRLLFDYLAFITDWMIETKRAAKLYINNSVQN